MDGDVKALDEARDVPRRAAGALRLVERRVVDRGSVPQRRGQLGRQVLVTECQPGLQGCRIWAGSSGE